jgi:DNA-binding transcriptional LysR family regulator
MAFRNMRIWRYIEEVARVGSVRQAAERLNLTPSALLRRIQDVEHDLGSKIFERNVSGMRPTDAGEILIQWIRNQDADLRRVFSHIEELKGLQRGDVRIACSQAVGRSFLLQEIMTFRKAYPYVKYHVQVTDHSTALQSLVNYDSDLVLIFKPQVTAELQVLASTGQRLVAIMAADHPLAGEPVLRLRECMNYPIALPDRSFGGREIIEQRLVTSSVEMDIAMEANSFEMLSGFVMSSDAITFQIEIGALLWREDPRLAVRPISDTDTPYGPLVLGHLKGRGLPLSTAKFAEQVARSMEQMRTLPVIEE